MLFFRRIGTTESKHITKFPRKLELRTLRRLEPIGDGWTAIALKKKLQETNSMCIKGVHSRNIRAGPEPLQTWRRNWGFQRTVWLHRSTHQLRESRSRPLRLLPKRALQGTKRPRQNPGVYLTYLTSWNIWNESFFCQRALTRHHQAALAACFRESSNPANTLLSWCSASSAQNSKNSNLPISLQHIQP